MSLTVPLLAIAGFIVFVGFLHFIFFTFCLPDTDGNCP